MCVYLMSWETMALGLNPSSLSFINIWWTTAMTIYLYIICGCFLGTMVELNSCNKDHVGGCSCSSVVEHLPSRCKALDSILNTTYK